MHRFFTLLFASCLFLSPVAFALPPLTVVNTTCHVQTVISGNTFTCRAEDGAMHTFTLDGYAAPATDSPEAEKSRQELESWIVDKTLDLPELGTDAQGRTRTRIQVYEGSCPCPGIDYSRGCAICACERDLGEEMHKAGLLTQFKH